MLSMESIGTERSPSQLGMNSREAMDMDSSTLRKADARFMVVCCSAFVNYAMEGTSSAGDAEFPVN